jgi:hypothetical protein
MFKVDKKKAFKIFDSVSCISVIDVTYKVIGLIWTFALYDWHTVGTKRNNYTTSRKGDCKTVQVCAAKEWSRAHLGISYKFHGYLMTPLSIFFKVTVNFRQACCGNLCQILYCVVQPLLKRASDIDQTDKIKSCMDDSLLLC